jgi:GTP pyrophosphokinase
VLVQAVPAARGTRRDLIQSVRVDVEEGLCRSHRHEGGAGREKTLYGIYRKMATST